MGTVVLVPKGKGVPKQLVCVLVKVPNLGLSKCTAHTHGHTTHRLNLKLQRRARSKGTHHPSALGIRTGTTLGQACRYSVTTMLRVTKRV